LPSEGNVADPVEPAPPEALPPVPPPLEPLVPLLEPPVPLLLEPPVLLLEPLAPPLEPPVPLPLLPPVPLLEPPMLELDPDDPLAEASLPLAVPPSTFFCPLSPQPKPTSIRLASVTVRFVARILALPFRPDTVVTSQFLGAVMAARAKRFSHSLGGSATITLTTQTQRECALKSRARASTREGTRASLRSC
jgi:hypothetical protein